MTEPRRVAGDGEQREQPFGHVGVVLEHTRVRADGAVPRGPAQPARRRGGRRRAAAATPPPRRPGRAGRAAHRSRRGPRSRARSRRPRPCRRAPAGRGSRAERSAAPRGRRPSDRRRPGSTAQLQRRRTVLERAGRRDARAAGRPRRRRRPRARRRAGRASRRRCCPRHRRCRRRATTRSRPRAVRRSASIQSQVSRATRRAERMTRSPATSAGRRAPAMRCRTTSSRSAARPSGVDRVAREAAGELVVHAAAGHRLARSLDHAQRRCPSRCARGGAADSSSTIDGRELRCRRRTRRARRRTADRQRRDGGGELLRGRRVTRRRHARLLRESADDALSRGQHLVAPLGPGLRDRREQLRERRHAVARRRREVGAAEERLARRRREHRHRPAAVAGQRLGRLHVDGVDVRPLLAVDLDGDEVLVEVAPRSPRPRTTRAP